MLCNSAAFQGYFGFFPSSRRQLDAYPYGGFSQYMTAAPQRLVKLPAEVSFDLAARFGYIGTSFAALRAGNLGAGGWVAINGITGTLGVAATLLALGMGATRILGFGRNTAIMSRLTALAPHRIGTLPLGERPLGQWLREQTDQLGVDLLIDCSARGAAAEATADALTGLKRGGTAVNIGALTERLPIEPLKFMTSRLQFKGSNWFTTGEAELMAEMVRTGVLDLSPLITQPYPLERVNDALEAVKARPGGFVNIVVNPNL
jgi:alcohol dehydrogenase